MRLVFRDGLFFCSSGDGGRDERREEISSKTIGIG